MGHPDYVWVILATGGRPIGAFTRRRELDHYLRLAEHRPELLAQFRVARLQNGRPDIVPVYVSVPHFLQEENGRG